MIKHFISSIKPLQVFSFPILRLHNFKHHHFTSISLQNPKSECVFPWKIAIDYYKSEKYCISWLNINQIQDSSSDLKKNLNNLLESKLCSTEEFEEQFKIYTSILTKIKTNSNQIQTKVSKNDLDFITLLKFLKEDKLLAEITNDYSVAQKWLSKTIEIISELGQIDNLVYISNIMITLNILNLQLWKSIIQITFTKPEKFTSLSNLSDLLENIRDLFENFNYEDNTDNKYARKNIYFNEKELSSILTKENFSTFYTRSYSILASSAKDNNNQLNMICKIVNLMCNINSKYSKVAFADRFKERKFVSDLSKIISSKLDVVAPTQLSSLLANLIIHGDPNIDSSTKIINYILKHQEKFTNIINSLELLRVWKNSGTFDNNIYQAFVKQNLSELLEKPGFNPKLITLAYDLSVIKLADQAIWEKLLQKIEEIDIEKLVVFQKKSLHLMFNLLQSNSFVNLDLSKLKDKINYLAKFCIGLRYEQDFTPLKIKHEENSLIDCCSQESIDRYKKLSLESAAQMKNVKDQHYPNTKQEIFIKNAIKKYFPIFSSKNIIFHDDLSFCCYKIDLALSIEGVHNKIAIEILGSPYLLENGKVIGKKQAKFEMLIHKEWLPIYIITGKTVSSHLLALKDNNTAEKTIAESCYKALQKELKEKKGIDLSMANQTSKWKKNIEK